MKEWMIYVPTILVCLPVLMTVLFYQVYVRMKKNKWEAVHFSAQYSVIFYVIADTILLNWVFLKNLLGIIVIFLIVLLSVILIMQRKEGMEVALNKGIVVLSRLSFLIFSVVYIGLLLYVVISGYIT